MMMYVCMFPCVGVPSLIVVRWRSIMSVDDIVGEVLDLLEEKKIADDTYVVFTSDHGYQRTYI